MQGSFYTSIISFYKGVNYGIIWFFEKKYTDWTLDVDGKEQENVTIY